MNQKKIGKFYYVVGRKSGFGIGFDLSRYGLMIEAGLWFIGIERG